ncbi:MAG: hypothetical protein PHG49_03900 [Candidatus Pacebacteria bacterium]|nr:hypothetical protein [Candidatus Paceibacterota bacterium]
MHKEILNKLRDIFIKSNEAVSELEYTHGNYDELGKLIEKDLPIITTVFCEIGLYDNKVYFVFIIDPKTFKIEVFNVLKTYSSLKIYGFKNFNKNLFPINNFKIDSFMKEILKEKYLQIQFSFQKMEAEMLFKEYIELIDIFRKNKIMVVNQLKNILAEKEK